MFSFLVLLNGYDFHKGKRVVTLIGSRDDVGEHCVELREAKLMESRMDFGGSIKKPSLFQQGFDEQTECVYGALESGKRFELTALKCTSNDNHMVCYYDI